MREIGFKALLKDQWLSPIITTFLSPADGNFEFGRFYDEVKACGFIRRPGKLISADRFRIGSIGQLDGSVMQGVLTAVNDACDAMGLANRAPATDHPD